MTETKREYWRAYAKANRDKRRESNRRWREKNREKYNAVQRENNRRYRAEAGAKPRVKVEKPKPVVNKPVLSELALKFLAYRRSRQ